MQTGRIATIHRLFRAQAKSSVVAYGKRTAFNPSYLCRQQKETLKHEGNYHLRDKTFQWHIRDDLQVSAILMGLQKSYIKFSSFLCECVSRAKNIYYSKKNWSIRKSHSPETKNVANQPHVDQCSVVSTPPYYIGPNDIFVKALDRNGRAFPFLCDKFPSLSTGKIKVGIFIDPQLRRLFRDLQFDLALSDDEKTAWSAFRHFSTGFLGSVKAVNFRKLLEDLPLLTRSSAATHHSRRISSMDTWDSIPVNCGAASDGTWWAFSLEYLSEGERIQAQMECCYFSRPLLGSKEEFSGNSGHVTS